MADAAKLAPAATLTCRGLRTCWRQAGPEDGGKGRILLLHGWGSESAVIWPLGESLADDGFLVNALDLPGFGETQAPAQAWSVADYAVFVSEWMEQLAIARAHFIGHSFGGSVSIMLAAQEPTRLEKLVLLNSAGVRRPMSRWPRWRSDILRAARRGLRRMGWPDAAHGLSEWAAARYGSPDYRAAQGVMRATLVRILAEDMTALAARVRAPTLLLWGELDDETPIWQGELLARTIPDAGLHIFPGAGHFAFLEHLAETRLILRHFFGEGE